MKINSVFDIDSDIDIANIMFDSRKGSKDSIFFAMKGKINDGHKFIDKAIDNGAICIVHSDDVDKKDGVLYIRTDDVQKAYIDFCKAYYDNTIDKMNVIGITGWLQLSP